MTDERIDPRTERTEEFTQFLIAAVEHYNNSVDPDLHEVMWGSFISAVGFFARIFAQTEAASALNKKREDVTSLDIQPYLSNLMGMIASGFNQYADAYTLGITGALIKVDKDATGTMRSKIVAVYEKDRPLGDLN